jgi:hypothetical protein
MLTLTILPLDLAFCILEVARASFAETPLAVRTGVLEELNAKERDLGAPLDALALALAIAVAVALPDTEE